MPNLSPSQVEAILRTFGFSDEEIYILIEKSFELVSAFFAAWRTVSPFPSLFSFRGRESTERLTAQQKLLELIEQQSSFPPSRREGASAISVLISEELVRRSSI